MVDGYHWQSNQSYVYIVMPHVATTQPDFDAFKEQKMFIRLNDPENDPDKRSWFIKTIYDPEDGGIYGIRSAVI